MEDKRSLSKSKPKTSKSRAKAKKTKRGPTPRKKPEENKTPPVSEQQRRLRLIKEILISHKTRGNPRDYVVITHRSQIMDVGGVYEIKAKLPDKIEAGNHVWVRGYVNQREIVAAAIVVEDNIDVDGKLHTMLRDEPRTKEWLLDRADLSPLPLTMAPMLIHKRRLGFYLGEGWAGTFWNHKLNRRRAKPQTRIIQRLN